MILLTSVICVVFSLEFGVATPKGNRYKDSHLLNKSNNEFNVERNIGEPTNPYNNPNNQNEFIYQENKRNAFMKNENYDKIYANNNPAAFRNVNGEQTSMVSESKEYNKNTANNNKLNDESFRSSYIASLPQVNRMQSFRPNDEVNNDANMPRMVDILSEVDNPNTDSTPDSSKAQIIQENNRANEIINKYNRQNSQALENINENKEEEDGTLSDVPVATPEYINKMYNVKPTITNSPRNDINNRDIQPNSQNVNEATFQNPSAETLYETGQAKPYEINNKPSVNSRPGHTKAQNIYRDKQRLKNLYLQSKPTKHYMIVYPDGRVEQVDQLDKIRRVHPNYVMLNAKELLQHGQPNPKNTGSQGSVVKRNLRTTNTNTKSEFNSIKDYKYEQINKEPQIINEQAVPASNEMPVATELPVIATTEVTKTNNIVIPSKDQLKESEINNNEENNKLNDEETNKMVTTSDNSDNQVNTASTTETPDIEDIETTVRCIPTTNWEILNQNNSNSAFNSTENPMLLKQPEDSNTSGGNLTKTKDDSVLADENTTPSPKQESNNEDENIKNTTTSDLNTIKENSYTTDRIDTSNVKNETYTNSSLVDSSVNREENNPTKLNNETVITSKDGTDSDGNTFHIETIVTNSTNESSGQNLESNNVTPSNSSTLVTNANTTETENPSTENPQNNGNPLNVTSSDSLTKKDENNTDTTTVQNLSNVTNSEVDRPKNYENNLNPDQPNNNTNSVYKNAASSNTTGEAYNVNSVQEESNPNKTLSKNIKRDDSKVTDDDTDDIEALPTGNTEVDNKKARSTAKDVSNGQDDEDGGTKNETKPEKTNTDDDLDTESPNSDEVIVNESSFWFKANESFWNKLMDSNDHNSFYFLFPRPQPNTKETKKTIYPNGTVVIETIETVDNGDGETNSTKTVVACGNCTTCDKTS